MSAPRPITEPEMHVRTQSAYDLEKVLVTFIERMFDAAKLDNPTLNLAQPSGEPTVQPLIVHDPDQPPVSYDYVERARTLALKVPPRVERGRVPRTVTGAIDAEKLPDCPAIIVQATGAVITTSDSANQKKLTVKIWIVAYDENPDGGGYQDCLNMAETLEIALIQFRVLDEAYPLVMPVEWNLIEADTFPHYVIEMVVHYQLPAARPTPSRELGYPYIFPEPSVSFP